MPETGNEVDFVILDTMHILPGEVLDLISILPYMKDGTVVVLHDTSLNLYTDNRYCYANSAVFSSIVANKYINYDTDKSENAYPNIGAFIVDKETKNNVTNLFLSLFISWKYYPDENQIKSYKKAIDNLYGNTGRYLFEQALKLNKIHL